MVYGSIYGASRIGVSEGSFDPRYAGPDGPDLMVQEAFDFEQRMFDVVVEHDFLECAAMQSVEMESALIAIDENFVSDMWEKVKDFIKKIKDKIVSIAKAAAVKLNAFFTKDNAALVSKYRSQFDNADQSKIIIKGWRSVNDSAEITSGTPSEVSTAVEDAMRIIDTSKQEDFKKRNTVDKILSSIIGRSTTASSFSKDAEKIFFKSPRDVKADLISDEILESLTNYSDSVKEIETAKKDMTDALDDAEKKIDDQKKKAENSAKERGDNVNKDPVVVMCNCAKYYISEYSKATGKIFTAILDALKTHMKQSRKAFVKIASKGASVSEAALMEETIDLQDYEVDSFFEQYSYDYEDLIA